MQFPSPRVFSIFIALAVRKRPIAAWIDSSPERSSKPKILFRNFFMNDRGKNAGPVDVSSAFGDEVIVFAPVLEPPPRRQRLRLEAVTSVAAPGGADDSGCGSGGGDDASLGAVIAAAAEAAAAEGATDDSGCGSGSGDDASLGAVSASGGVATNTVSSVAVDAFTGVAFASASSGVGVATDAAVIIVIIIAIISAFRLSWNTHTRHLRLTARVLIPAASRAGGLSAGGLSGAAVLTLVIGGETTSVA